MTRPCYVHRHVVTFAETNLVGNVYFAHYLLWQGHCREMFLAEHAPSVVAAVRDGSLALVTVSCAVDFHAECFALDTVEVRMSLRSSAGNRVAMNFDYLRDGTPVARGRQEIACMARGGAGMTPVVVPAELDAALREYRASAA